MSKSGYHEKIHRKFEEIKTGKFDKIDIDDNLHIHLHKMLRI